MHPVLELGRLDPQTFEQMVNSLGLVVLGAGLMSFGPGSDGGRDGYFVGTAPYPSPSDQWSGTWYIQSKFHAPHLTADAYEWLLAQIDYELKQFQTSPRRQWPDIWIIATNIDPSGVPQTGAFDKAMARIRSVRPALADRFAIWGGKRLLDFLANNPKVAQRYGHFLTAGHVLSRVMALLEDYRASPTKIIRHLIEDGLRAGRRVRLEQAGDTGTGPDIHRLFVDLPFRTLTNTDICSLLAEEAYASAEHFTGRVDDRTTGDAWRGWYTEPRRAQAWLILAGPGTGKTTLGQFTCQIHRSAILEADSSITNDPEISELARDTKSRAVELGVWPAVPRIPLHVDLSQYAHWLGKRSDDEARGLLTYIATKISASLQEEVSVAALRATIDGGRWLLVCDGLDEVPGTVKEAVSAEIVAFFQSVRNRCDLHLICTSRPQGYSGQLKELGAAEVILLPLSEQLGLECARRLLDIYGTRQESEKGAEILKRAIKAPAIRQLMSTPLQVHIMTIIVRQGQRPPEKKWELFRRFYEVIYLRESSKPLAGAPEAALLRDERKLISAVHKTLGFVLHARAETSDGSTSALPRTEFEDLVAFIVSQWKEASIAETCTAVHRASTERLVLINTPDSKDSVRFDVRQLQEFFAAEFLCEGVNVDDFRERLVTIAHDSHWREVVHFVLSAILEQDRETELAVVIDVLNRMNDSTLYGEGRTLGNIILTGSAAAAGLLADGVLDPDKRVRERFRSLIRQLGSARSEFQIRPLLAVRAPESLKWMIDVLFEQMTDSAEEYTVGSSVVLFLMSERHWRDIIATWATWKRSTRYEALRLLDRSASLYEFAPDKLYALLADAKIGMDAGLSLSPLHHRGVDAAQAARANPAVGEALANVTMLGIGLTAVRGLEHDYGWVIIIERQNTLRPTAEQAALAEAILRQGCSGYYGFLASLVLYANRLDRESFLCVLEYLVDDLYNRYACGVIVNGWEVFSIPDNIPMAQAMEHVRGMEEAQFAENLRSGDFGLWRCPPAEAELSFRGDGSGDDAKLVELLKADMRAGRFVFSLYPDALARLRGHKDLVRDVFFSDIEFFLHLPPTWSYFEAILGAIVREALCRAATAASIDVGSMWDRHQCDWRLNLPEEACLLPSMAGFFSGRLAQRHEIHRISQDRAKALKAVRAEATRLVKDLGKTMALLEGDVSAEVKFAAAIIALLHVEGGVELVAERSEALLAVSEDVGAPAVLSFVWCVDAVEGLLHAPMRALVNDLVAKRRWSGWEHHANVWFSRSVGRVARAGKIARWLRAAKNPNWLVPSS